MCPLPASPGPFLPCMSLQKPEGRDVPALKVTAGPHFSMPTGGTGLLEKDVQAVRHSERLF